MAIKQKRITWHINRQMKLNANRANWNSLWDELSDYLCPGRITSIKKRSPGVRINSKVFDNTGAEAAQKLAAGLYSRTVNPASKWFFLTVDDSKKELQENKEISEWLDLARDKTQSVINKTATGALYQVYSDLTSLASTVMFIDEDPIRGVSFKVYPIDTVDIAEDYRGVVDTVYRKFKMTLRQADQEFPDKLPEDIKNRIEEDPDMPIEILHVVGPRKNYNPAKIDNLNMPIESIYILIDKEIVLQESGYPEMPYVVPRLEVMAGELYGRGPGNIALPEIKSLNEMCKLRLDTSNLRARPPLDVPLNAYVNPIMLIPGYKNLNQDEGGRRASALNVAGELSYTSKDIEESRAKVREMFYNDQLYLQNGPQMTATEVNKRSEIQMQLMGPWQGRLELELFEPMITRIVGILLRSGQIPPPPQELFGLTEETTESEVYTTDTIKIVYDSPLARAQRLVDVQVIDQVKISVAQSIQLNPQGAQEVLMRFNLSQMEVDRARALGLPTKYIRTEQELQQMQEAAAEQAKQQQAMAQMNQMADAGEKIGNTPGGEELTKDLYGKLQGQMSEGLGALMGAGV